MINADLPSPARNAELPGYISRLLATQKFDPQTKLERALIRKINTSARHHRAALAAQRSGDLLIAQEARRRALDAWHDAEEFAFAAGVPIESPRIIGTPARMHAALQAFQAREEAQLSIWQIATLVKGKNQEIEQFVGLPLKTESQAEASRAFGLSVARAASFFGKLRVFASGDAWKIRTITE